MMKSKLFLLFIIAIVSSCGNIIIDAGKKGDQLSFDPVKKYSQISQQLKYLSIIYDEKYAPGLLEKTVSGKVFYEFQDQINSILHSKFKFPIVIQNENFNKRNLKEVVPWWKSIPEEFEKITIDSNREIAHFRNTEMILYSLFFSGPGLNILEKHFDHLEKKINSIDFVTGKNNTGNDDAISDMLSDIITTYDLSSSLTGLYEMQEIINYGYNFLMFSDNIIREKNFKLIRNNFLKNKIDSLKPKFIDSNLIHNNLESKVDYNFDENVYNEVESKHDIVENVEKKINSIFNNILLVDNKKEKEKIGHDLFIGNEFQKIIQDTYKAAIETQNFIINNGIYNKVIVPHLKVVKSYEDNLSLTEYLVEEIYFKLPNSSNVFSKKITEGIMSISFKDMLLLKRLSLLRLNLMANFFSGEELLELRRNAADWDLYNILLPIKSIVNNIPEKISKDINEIAELPVLPENNQVLWWYTLSNDLSEIVYCHYKLENTEGLKFINPNQKYVSIEELNALVRNAIFEFVFDIIPDYNEMMIASASEIAQWEIILYSHIYASY